MRVRPSTTAASISVHGAWQIAPDGLAHLEERADELDRLGLRAQVVRVGHAARQHQPVVVGRVRVRDDHVDREGVRLVEVVERLDLARFGRDQVGLGAGVLERLARLGRARPARCPRSRRGSRSACRSVHPPCRVLSIGGSEDCADFALPWTNARTRVVYPKVMRRNMWHKAQAGERGSCPFRCRAGHRGCARGRISETPFLKHQQERPRSHPRHPALRRDRHDRPGPKCPPASERVAVGAAAFAADAGAGIGGGPGAVRRGFVSIWCS